MVWSFAVGAIFSSIFHSPKILKLALVLLDVGPIMC